VHVRKLLIGLGLGVVAGLTGLALGAVPFVRTIERKTYDQRVRWTADPASARQDIVLILIDEDSVRRLEPVVGRWPWPRVVHADLIDYLGRAPARVIAYDVLFTERDRRGAFPVGDAEMTGAESDAALVNSTERAGTVVHLADASFEGLEGTIPAALPLDGRVGTFAVGDMVEDRPALLAPFDDLAKASRAIGHNLFVLDEDGPLRQTTPFVRVAGRAIPSLALAAVFVAENRAPEDIRAEPGRLLIGERSLRLVRAAIPAAASGERGPSWAWRALINFRGPAVLADGRTPYPTYSFYRLFYSQQQLLAGEKPLVDPEVFREKMVFVGVTAAGLHDVFAGPFGQSGQLPGAQIHANAADDALSGRSIGVAGRAADAAMIALPALGVGTSGALLPVWAASIVALAMVGSVVWVSVALFRAGIWVALAQPLAAVAVALVAAVFYQYVVEGREKRQVRRLFGRYVSHDVLEQLLAHPELARLGGERRTMTVLFSDIRGFTAVSEEGRPEDIVDQLNEYFSAMVRVLLSHRGTLDKFVGDMVMALFGAPLDDPEHADHAVSAGLAMVAVLDDLNRQWRSQGRPALEIGIGINTGEMIAGNVGSDTIMSYTVIGDAVNLGARLESLNKEWGTRIIVSEATRRNLKHRYDMRPLGEVTVKGRSEPVNIYEVRQPVGTA
jgi:adenylate cyclase